ncbi:hypothetical protein Pan216_54110 [Planctomycetes bacterium Pan216]|uniref:Uncharacterized protein n=1 Tax=Kolteria novifilia TaxID=2527975 RepID=A0A518BC08_9BACT|nr:hypothetical protein Pan216_54110 [Planctomycetes bacterium Pan216]
MSRVGSTGASDQLQQLAAILGRQSVRPTTETPVALPEPAKNLAPLDSSFEDDFEESDSSSEVVTSFPNRLTADGPTERDPNSLEKVFERIGEEIDTSVEANREDVARRISELVDQFEQLLVRIDEIVDDRDPESRTQGAASVLESLLGSADGLLDHLLESTSSLIESPSQGAETSSPSNPADRTGDLPLVQRGLNVVL